MKKNIIILGSTGSIGSNTLNVLIKDKKKFDIVLLSTIKIIQKITKQASEFNVKNIIINNYKNFVKSKITRNIKNLIF